MLYGLMLFCTMQLEVWKGRLLDTALGLNTDPLGRSMLFVCAALTAAALLQYVYSLAKARLLTNADRYLRKRYFEALLNKSMRTYLTISEGRINADYTDKLDTVYKQYFFTGALLIENVLLTIMVLIALGRIHYSFVPLAVCALAVPLFVPRLLKKRLVNTSKAQMEAMNAHLSAFRTWLKGIDVIKAFACEHYIMFRYDTVNELLYKKEMEAETVKSIETGMSFLVTLIVEILLLIYGAYLIYTEKLSAGTYYTVIGLIDLLTRPMFWTASFLESIFSSFPARQALQAFMTEEDAPSAYTAADSLPHTNIKAQSLVFSYTSSKTECEQPEGKVILHGISFSIQERQLVFFSGASGTGKSTIMRLLSGMYAPDSGSLTIGGSFPQAIYPLSSIVAIQQQEAYIFRASLWDNLLLGREAPEEEVSAVLSSVGLEKYAAPSYLKDTIVGDQYGFSGGEKKRISIARTILRNCPVMIFDEPLANIDSENISKVKQALFSLSNRATVIIISHLIDEDCKKAADAIYTLQKGHLYA